MADKGFLQAQTIRLPPFSGENLKGDVSFEAWLYEAEGYLNTHSTKAVRDAIQKSLKGKAYDALINLGKNRPIEEILNAFRIKFGIVATVDSLMSDIYSMKQLETETVANYETRLKSKFSAIQTRYPD